MEQIVSKFDIDTNQWTIYRIYVSTAHPSGAPDFTPDFSGILLDL